MVYDGPEAPGCEDLTVQGRFLHWEILPELTRLDLELCDCDDCDPDAEIVSLSVSASTLGTPVDPTQVVGGDAEAGACIELQLDRELVYYYVDILAQPHCETVGASVVEAESGDVLWLGAFGPMDHVGFGLPFSPDAWPVALPDSWGLEFEKSCTPPPSSFWNEYDMHFTASGDTLVLDFGASGTLSTDDGTFDIRNVQSVLWTDGEITARYSMLGSLSWYARPAR